MTKPLSSKWQERFALFDSVGGDITSQQYREALKNMTFFTRMKFVGNLFAFLFGILYFCILGLWKKGLVLVCLNLVANLIVAIVEIQTGKNLESAYRAVNICYAVFCSQIANYAYYLKETKGLQSWNPFEGFTKKSAARISSQ